jgi:hypothetical protein
MRLEEIKAELCWRLRRRGCWGARYLPVGALVGWLGQLVKGDGRSVQAAVEELISEGLLLSHKKRRTVSLNPRRVREINALIEEYF